MNTSTAINSSDASTAKEKEAVATSNEEVEKSSVELVNEAGDSGVYSSTSSGHIIDASKTLAAPENTTPVSIENKLDEEEKNEEEEDKNEFEEFEDDLEPDSEDDFPEFTGGQPRGRVVLPIAGKPGRPTRPK